MDIKELLAHPDVVVTEEDAIAEGAVREMDGWGTARFRGDPVRTVSDTLFKALQDAFGLAATAGLTMTEQDWAETLAERAADGQTAPAVDDLDGRTGLAGHDGDNGGVCRCAPPADGKEGDVPSSPKDDIVTALPLAQPAHTCTACGEQLDRVLIASRETVHPNCGGDLPPKAAKFLARFGTEGDSAGVNPDGDRAA